MSLAVATRYAQALADIAFDPEPKISPADLERQVSEFLEEYKASLPLREVLASPAVAASKKRAVIDRIGQQLSFSKIATNFLYVVIDHHRAPMLRLIVDAFGREIDRRGGIERAEVISAVELNDQQKAQFEERAAEMTGKKVRCTFIVDPSVLGGAVLKVGSKVYDGSVRARLHEIGAKLAASV